MAKFKPGEARHPNAGRKKGTPNKSTQSILELCEAMNFSPIEAMLKIASNQVHEKNFEALKEVCTYIYPKRKSLEHSGSLDPKLMEAAEQVASLNKEQQIELLETELKKLKGE